MIKNLRTISFLLIAACSLVFFLFGFTLYHHKELTTTEPSGVKKSVACGTPANPFRITLSELELKDTVRFIQVKKGEQIFFANCRACHRMNQKLVGPALAGVFDRRDSVWIRTLIVDIDILIKRKDTAVMNLRKKYDFIEHTRFTSLTKEELDNLIYYLKIDQGGRMFAGSKVIACP